MANNKTVLENSCRFLLESINIVKVIIALHKEDQYFKHTSLASNPKVITVVGGKTRAESVLKALQQAATEKWVLVHDAVRPLLSKTKLNELISTVIDNSQSAILATKCTSTAKLIESNTITTLNREQIWLAQTPQIFARTQLISALQKNLDCTDEASAMESLGVDYQLVTDYPSNIKITNSRDLDFANNIGFNKINCSGIGYDVHAFGKPIDKAFIVIGGVKIAYAKPLIAHSDGDVLLHSICDAMLGCAGLGDIGMHFADTAAKYKDIDSRLLLKKCQKLLQENQVSIANIDATIIAQAPKMQQHIIQMRSNIASDLNLEVAQVNIKATTTERLGFEGRKQGIATMAIVSASKIQ